MHFMWPNVWRNVLAVMLAFIFGRSLTFRDARAMGQSPSEATHAHSTDMVPIISMDIVP